MLVIVTASCSELLGLLTQKAEKRLTSVSWSSGRTDSRSSDASNACESRRKGGWHCQRLSSRLDQDVPRTGRTIIDAKIDFKVTCCAAHPAIA